MSTKILAIIIIEFDRKLLNLIYYDSVVLLRKRIYFKS